MTFKTFALFLTLFFFTLDPVKSETRIGIYGDWEAFVGNEGGNPVCFIGSSPIKMKGIYKTRGQTYILITHRPYVKENNVVMVAAGYKFKKGSKAWITIGKIETELFTEASNAFASNESDKTLIKLMIKSSIMVVKGVSSRGTLTTDTYSLRGFTAAYKSINKRCKLQ